MGLLLSTLWHYFRRRPKLVAGYILTTVLMICLWVADPLLARIIIDNVGLVVSSEMDTSQFVALFALWITLSLVLSVVQAAHKMICWRSLNNAYCEFQADTYGHILNMDVIQHISRRAGGIIKKIDNASDQIWDLGFEIFQVIIPSIIAGIIFISIAATVSVKMTAIVCALLFLYACVLLWVTKKAHPMQTAISRIWVSVIGRAYDIATNILPMKSAPGEARELQRMRYWNKRGLALQCRTDYYWGILEGVSIFMLLRALIIGLGIYLIGRNELTLGELFFFLFIIFRLVAPIEVVGSFLPKWNEKIEKVRMGVKMGSLPSIVKNPKNGKRPKDVHGKITFQNVSFSYEESNPEPVTEEDENEDDEIDILDPRINIHEEVKHSYREPLPELVRRSVRRTSDEPQNAIHGISLSIQPGEHMAFVGHSGAGKSTVASLVNRFYDVTSGAILLDDVDIRELDLFWLRARIGLVLQDSSMFNDSIMENIRYTKPSASDAEVRDAAKRASAHEFIMEMPEKYLTNIGERGVRLSGGERQRIAIARAILKRPSIVVLDEATSALDSKTEKAVQDGIKELIANRTAIIIAHRLSTVRSCDRIAVLEKGKLIACASHKELMKSCHTYREMVELQSHGMLAE